MKIADPQALYLIGTSAATRALDDEIDLASRADAKVLITGETGVGKDVVARLIHSRSARRMAPLAAINCAGLPDTLLESELFGHVRGSFTGAHRDKAGLFEAAANGTAFLDEAGEMSTRMQTVLLRFLETGELQRVGSDRALTRVNVRVVAATNRDLRVQIAAGAFREDLYYRLNVIRIHVTPLRERREDIEPLLDHFLNASSRQYDGPRRRLSPEAMDLLVGYRWPGNVRELKNVVERLVVKTTSDVVRGRDLPEECQPVTTTVAAASTPHASTDPDHDVSAELAGRMIDRGESFWSVVHAPFIARDLSREQLRNVVRKGLERTRGNYRLLVQLFNMPTSDYKRFLGFLRKHDCHVPFHAFRVVPLRPHAVTAVQDDYAQASGM